ncbi:MAG: CoA-binding protein [Candidatus Helarchaeota archaeon]
MFDYDLIDTYFNPKSVALIGASRKPFGAASSILTSILHKKFSGDIYLINTRAAGEKLHGYPLYQSILDCPPVDLAFIIVPSKYVKSVIEDCIKIGIKNGIIISSGFKESILYDKSKVELEHEIVTIARAGGLRLIGPNCNGIVNIPSNFYAFFGPRMKVEPGVCSYVTRGGTAGGFILMGSAMPGRGLGVNKLVNIGDACDLTIGDFIQYFDQDPSTEVIGIYTEGINEGSKLLSILKKVNKPVIFYKSGQTPAGQRAAMSHVGAIASTMTHSIYQGFISQAGVIPADSINDMLDFAAAFSHSPLPHGKKVGIFTFGGSLGVMMTDTAEKYGLDVAPLSQSQISALNQMLPEYWSHSNPVDITDASSVYNPRNLLKAFSIILEEYDGLLIITPIFEKEDIFDYAENETNFRNMYKDLVKRNIKYYRRLIQSGKTVFVLGEYGELSDLFYRNGIPVFESFEQIAKVYQGLYTFTNILKRKGLFETYNQQRAKKDL